MKLAATFILALSTCYVQAQVIEPRDTAVVFSMTIFNRKNEVKSHFPDVYPNVHMNYLVSGTDTVACSYEFPFLIMAKQGFHKIKNSRNAALNFTYDYVAGKLNARYRLLVPIRFYFTYSGAKFIVIEHWNKNHFFATQQWGGTLYTGEEVKVEQVY